MNEPPGQATLNGLQVLIVEDRYLIASDVEVEVRRLGGSIAGLAPTVARAKELLGETQIDLAILDVNLENEKIYPFADVLAARGLPFLFLTGYDEWLLPPKWLDRPRLTKPLNPRALRDAIAKLVS